ncbi:PapD-like protein [Fimicolochytrium jonesii]|uniref:PapD-like protein n=1 Tax=Fimicolochytrium jonesii TaxID=1396493 RepID=UPI0022FDCFC2|nr:PapD-like protein [Fimicolochytrium jonesii]KAI8817112.1 PapD-like protein [Fimicolochytrium jonesii]
MDSTSPQPFASLHPELQLEFTRPFTSVVKRTLTVSNHHTSSPVAFKVKTTAPKQYCVRPNSGIVLPSSKSEVQVLLQAMKEDPPAEFVSKDKFLVQIIKVPADVVELKGDELAARLSTLWSQADQLFKSSPQTAADVMVEKKLKCVFLPPAGETSTSSSTGLGSGSGGASIASSHLIDSINNTNPRLSTTDGFSDAHSRRVSVLTDAQSRPNATAAISPETTTPGASPITPVSPTAVSPSDKLPAEGAFSIVAPKRPPQPTVDLFPAPSSSSTTPSQSQSQTEKELKEVREKMKTLQAACDAYKAEVERLNMLRQRKGGAAATEGVGSLSASSSAALSASSTGGFEKVEKPHQGLPMGVGAAVAVAAFIVGAYLF